jgi:glucosamine--fructose-6-phosphate aminotransferase (isomerizing)
VKSRDARAIVVATEIDDEIEELADDVIEIPETIPELQPIVSVIPLQLLAYHIAVILGCDVDQPRNLAKSVTVE